jgi:hypothetical protein
MYQRIANRLAQVYLWQKQRAAKMQCLAPIKWFKAGDIDLQPVNHKTSFQLSVAG